MPDGGPAGLTGLWKTGATQLQAAMMRLAGLQPHSPPPPGSGVQ